MWPSCGTATRPTRIRRTPPRPATAGTTTRCSPGTPVTAYVDWFSFNEWKDGFNASWFMSQAAAHHKPVLMGEQSLHQESGHGIHLPAMGVRPFRIRTSSGVKGFQYINWNWPIYPISDWSQWADGKFTYTPADVSSYNAEMQNPKYIVRDSSITTCDPLEVWRHPGTPLRR